MSRFIGRGNDLWLRRHAMGAASRLALLPEVAEKDRAELARALAKALETGGRRVRQSALDALATLGKDAAVALPAIDTCTRHDPEGRVRERAKAVAEAVRKGSPQPVELGRLREELQRLREREEALEKRLERVESKTGGKKL